MHRSLVEKFKEAFTSVLPITIIVMLLHFTISPMPLGTVVLFITGTILLVIGMGIFTLGADMAIMPIGEFIGASLVKSRKLLIFVIGSFILGVAVTVAEPDLQVLAKQVPSVPDVVLLGSVAIGVGIFLVIALLRILFKMKLSYILLIMYSIVFLVAAFTSPDYLAVAFDSGGVTTGPITVPFILALGMGVSTVRSGKSAEEDSFGLCGISSIGPIIAVLIMGIFFDASNGGYGFETASTVNNLSELLSLYKDGIFVFFEEVTIAFSPIILIFAAYNIFYLKLPKRQIAKIAVGIVYTILGLTIFLTGVNIGFMPAGNYLGNSLASLSYNWILIPLSVLIGFFVVTAEPAVHVLNKQVEDITSGAISKKMMMAGLSLGVGIALALAMIRMMFGISIWFFLLPGYIIALTITFFVPQIFTAIAFDSGGVASGTMAATFLLPFAIGVSSALGGNPMTDAFGIIAMVAMMPLITVQIMGVIYMVKMKRNKDIIDYKEDDTELNDEDDFDIIEY
ncbi:DUF1538 domain-containing protein [Clostridium nigeriense]|uniref:DUF1538 domain-containing protein n=1 Tax=Clostridium nigeriense TaxID=1805470 RepID=UPI003D34C900